MNLTSSFLALDALKNNFNKSLQRDLKKIIEIETKLCICLQTVECLLIEKKLAQTKSSVYMVQHESQSEALKESEQLSISATVSKT